MGQRSSWSRVVVVLFGCGVASAAADEIKLEWQEKGMSAKVGYYQPQRLTLSEDKPESVTKLPDGIEKPKFGVLKIGPADVPTSCVFVVHEPKKGEAKLWVDANANGDLTDDDAVEWTSRSNKRGELELFQWSGRASVQVKYGDESRTLGLQMYRFDPDDPQRAVLKNVLLYYRDYGYSGKVTIGEKEYSALLVDDAATGDFRGKEDAKDSGSNLLIDLNGSEKFEFKGERFDVRQPFNVGGVTYEVSGLTAKGGTFEIIKSDKTVEEKPVPAIVQKGKKPPTFEAKTLDGKTVKFPQDFEGRLVMLDFWATWCGPCRAELPNLRKAYDEFHSQGFDVLGISIDDTENREKVEKFLKDNDMSWQQVNEEGAFDGRLPTTFGVTGIPACWLVDGKSGLIVAESASLRGENLRETISRRIERLGEPPDDDPTPGHSPRPDDPLLVKAREKATQDDLPNGLQFAEQRRSPTMGELLLARPSTQPLRGREIAQRALDAHVRCGWVFHCTKCSKWHLQLAGGYAITPDAIVTAFHVMAEPSATKLDQAYPIVVIGDDQIVPVTGVLAADSAMDTIVLRVGTTELKPLPLNDDARIGDTIYCLSDPQGIRSYFSAGMINRHYSLRAGSTDPRYQRIHVSSDWSKGSSGSAVLDEYGNAIGHVVRIQSLFNSDRASGADKGAATKSATVLNLHEAVPAKSVLSLLAGKATKEESASSAK
jgi:thiol-disulfide isomerase/thioredoxin